MSTPLEFREANALFPNPIDPNGPTSSAVISKCGKHLHPRNFSEERRARLPRSIWALL
jgi:hypothetical protein